MVVMLRQCCCGCTLKTGTIILGVLNAMYGFGIMNIGVLISTGDGSASNQQKDDSILQRVASEKKLEQEYIAKQTNVTMATHGKVEETLVASVYTSDVTQQVATHERESGGSATIHANVTTGAMWVVIGAIMLLVAICLIVGAKKSNPVLLIPWMVYAVIYVIVSTVLYIDRSVLLFGAERDPEGAGYITLSMGNILLETYFILVVYSLYRELKGTAPPTFA